MPAQVPLVLAHVLARRRSLAGGQLEHLVDEQERLAVRENLLDLRAAKGECDRQTATSL